MTRFQADLLRHKARWQTTTTLRRYRVREWWIGAREQWTEAELRAAWGDR